MGAAIGDYDNDGWDDIYVTGLGESRLFHNEHNGTFRDVTKTSGANNTGYGASAAWVDYDKDGKLDLFVTNYVKWSEKDDLYCTLDGRNKSYCTPEAYKGDTCRLFHNLGDGHFEDVTQKSGIYDPTSKSLGVAIIDYDQDGWPDLAVANDTERNKLYRNNHNGTFTEQAVQAGIAFSEDGIARGAMGIDQGDFDHSGYPSLAIGNFSNQMIGLYHNEGNRFFIDVAPSSSIGRASLLSLSFGLFFFDYDLDGLEDLFVANGHIEPDIARIQPQVTYTQTPLIFHNQGGSRFQEVGKQLGFSRKMVARGAAYADIDNDGRLDILLTTNGGPAYLYRNAAGTSNNAIRIKTVGTRSNRDGIGAVVKVERLKLADGPLRLELLLAERIGAHFWFGESHAGENGRNHLAERPEGHAPQPQGQRHVHRPRRREDPFKQTIRQISVRCSVRLPEGEGLSRFVIAEYSGLSGGQCFAFCPCGGQFPYDPLTAPSAQALTRRTISSAHTRSKARGGSAARSAYRNTVAKGVRRSISSKFSGNEILFSCRRSTSSVRS